MRFLTQVFPTPVGVFLLTTYWRIQKDLSNTIVLVTHDLAVHANVSDRIAIMYAGTIVEEGKTVDIFDRPAHPYTQHLIRSLPRLGDA
jgi:peptide/nickel transport system ATP-binding protein